MDDVPVNRYVYETPWPSFALAWSMRPEPRFRLAVGSMEQERNKIQIITLNEDNKQFEVTCQAEPSFPQTKLMFAPASGSTDLLASSDTQLNLWKVDEEQKITLQAKLRNKRAQEHHSPPLTSFDWSAVNNHKVGVCSVDTTCTIWNIENQRCETQLVAHDKTVYDIAFSPSAAALFVSVGADGSLRLFDQRNLESSTIMYETSPRSALLRLAWNRINTHLIACIANETPGVILVDIRRPLVALATYSADACVNHIAWAPHTRSHLLCGSEDGSALIWDVSADWIAAKPPPFLSYVTDHEINQVQWPSSQPDYAALGMAQRVEVLQL